MASTEGECSPSGFSSCLQNFLKLIKHFKRKCPMVKRKFPFHDKLLGLTPSATQLRNPSSGFRLMVSCVSLQNFSSIYNLLCLEKKCPVPFILTFDVSQRSFYISTYVHLFFKKDQLTCRMQMKQNVLISHSLTFPVPDIWLPWWLSGKESACQCGRCRFPSLGQEDPLEEGMATHSSILAWEIPWAEEPGGLESVGS